MSGGQFFIMLLIFGNGIYELYNLDCLRNCNKETAFVIASIYASRTFRLATVLLPSCLPEPFPYLKSHFLPFFLHDNSSHCILLQNF